MSILITNLGELRRKKNLKQEELASLVGVRRETIVYLEKGKYNPSLRLAYDLAKVFEKSIEQIFWYSEDEV